MLAESLEKANSMFLNNDRSPQRNPGELDTRGSHFYLAMYWAQVLAEQNDDADLKSTFTPIAQQLTENENKIVDELNSAQGCAVDIGGYYRPNREVLCKTMRPSVSLNAIIDNI